MPRYCDACRTFITSRDSLTVERNSDDRLLLTLETVKRETPELSVPTISALHREVGNASRVSVIPSANRAGQALNSCSCPKNMGNRRHFCGYHGHCTLYVEL